MPRFENRTVAITGASRSLGRNIAEAFGAEGAFVFVGYRTRRNDAEATLATIRSNGGDGATWAIDVRDEASVTSSVHAIVALRGSVDVLVNNAGLTHDGPFAMMSADAWSAVIETNLGGTFRCSRAVVRSMMAARSGSIINIASISGIHAAPGQANYSASKGGILALTRTLAAEVAPFGVRVNAVVPGFVATGMVSRMDRTIVESRIAEVPLKRLARADEITSVVLFLASEAASYIVGQAIVIDGGLSL